MFSYDRMCSLTIGAENSIFPCGTVFSHHQQPFPNRNSHYHITIVFCPAVFPIFPSFCLLPFSAAVNFVLELVGYPFCPSATYIHTYRYIRMSIYMNTHAHTHTRAHTHTHTHTHTRTHTYVYVFEFRFLTAAPHFCPRPFIYGNTPGHI